MREVDLVLILLTIAVGLTALARRLNAPYPALLALLGAALVFIPGVPHLEMQPELALTILVAPVLLDAAFDTSLRDLRRNWVPIAGLVVAAVGGTVVAVAFTVEAMVPALPWAAAIALGAIVAPPDAAAAAAVLKQQPLPYRLSHVLQGESLLNDVTALLIFRVAVVSRDPGSLDALPASALMLGVIAGSVVAGFVLAKCVARILREVADVPSSIVLQFVSTFGVWIAAESAGLSGILTMVVYAVTVSMQSGRTTPARMRVPAFAVWETIVFVLNVLAFVLIGLQLGPLLDRLSPAQRLADGEVALAVLGACIAVRFIWVFVYGLVMNRLCVDPSERVTARGGLVIGWSGMRGIVTLAAALALPGGAHPFPGRDLILLTAFVVVLGTLVIQGLTLGPLLRRLKLEDDGLVAREVALARREVHASGLATLRRSTTPAARALVRRKDDDAARAPEETGRLRLDALEASRARLDEMRRGETIGYDAFRTVQIELDLAELSARPADE